MNKDKPSRVEPIRSWDEYSEKVAALCSGWAFRGHADSTWPLMSTLGRYLNAYVKEKYWMVQEERIARIFQRKAHLFLTHIPERSDTFQWLALMQHHGAPTRLLDFTWSAYVAAFFALVHTTKQAAVWAVNPKRLVNVTEGLNDFLGDSRVGLMGIGEPFVMNTRLIAQSGTFIVTKKGVGAYEEAKKLIASGKLGQVTISRAYPVPTWRTFPTQLPASSVGCVCTSAMPFDGSPGRRDV